MPVGTILPYQGSLTDIPEKWHLCDGTNGTPDLRNGEFLEGSSSAKSFKSAGLPNIKGTIQASNTAKAATGAFADDGKSPSSFATMCPDHTTMYHRNFSFDASRCSSIYRDDISTVQPKSYTVMYIMKIET